MLDRYLIEHCSPTLASLKTASLFSIEVKSDLSLNLQLKEYNRRFGDKGLSIVALRRRGKTALIYLYRRTRLQADLNKSGVGCFLAEYGYCNTQVDCAISRLAKRLNSADSFPHEIGLFLGYPLEDVAGFIENEGKNCKFSGYWKVYCNEYDTRKLFARYQKCKEIYSKLYKQGKSVKQLTVAA